MTYPINGQFNIGSTYMPYSTMGSSYSNPYQSSVFNTTSSSSSTDMSSMMQFMMQMKQMEAMNSASTTSTSTNSIASSSSSSSSETTEIGNYDTDGSDLDAIKDFLNNQNKASTLNISEDLGTFSTNLIIALNDEAGFDSDRGNKISLSRMLNSLGISLTPNQADLLAYNLGVNPDDLDDGDVQKLLEGLGFKAGENNRYNLSVDMQKAVDKINNTTTFKIKAYEEDTNTPDTSKMTTAQFESVFTMFREDAPASATLKYGSLDNLSNQLMKAAASKNSNGLVTLDSVLKTIGVDVDTMSPEEKNKILLKAGLARIGTSNSDKIDNSQLQTKSIANTMSGWAATGETLGGAAGGAILGACVGGPIGAVIGGLIGVVPGLVIGITSCFQPGAESISLDFKDSDAFGIDGTADGDTELSQDQIKELLKTLGFGEKEVSKTKFAKALDTDNLVFNKSNIKNDEGACIFAEMDNLYGSPGTGNISTYENLIGTIVNSSGEYQQAAIEAYFDDFVNYSSQLINSCTQLFGTTFIEHKNSKNVQNVQKIFVGAQELIDKTTDPDKKAQYKQIYNAAVQNFAQEWSNAARLMIGQDCKTNEIAQGLLYTSAQITDYGGGNTNLSVE